PSADAICALGTSSPAFWNDQRLNGLVRQLASVTSLRRKPNSLSNAVAWGMIFLRGLLLIARTRAAAERSGRQITGPAVEPPGPSQMASLLKFSPYFGIDCLRLRRTLDRKFAMALEIIRNNQFRRALHVVGQVFFGARNTVGI